VQPLLETVEGFEWRSVAVGYSQAEVWRTNWPDEEPSDSDTHLGGVEN
jgi:hypothetical protein